MNEGNTKNCIGDSIEKMYGSSVVGESSGIANFIIGGPIKNVNDSSLKGKEGVLLIAVETIKDM